MQLELTALQPELIKTSAETDQMMVKIEGETVEVDAKKELVSADEKVANDAAAAAQGIKVYMSFKRNSLCQCRNVQLKYVFLKYTVSAMCFQKSSVVVWMFGHRLFVFQEECEGDLAEAMPALEAALSALDTLKPSDITLIKSMQNPPGLVKLVMESICIMKGIKPERKPDPSGSGKLARLREMASCH